MDKNRDFEKYFNRQIKFAFVLGIIIIVFFYIFLYFIAPVLPNYLSLFNIIVIFLSAFLSIVFGILIWLYIDQVETKRILEAKHKKGKED